MFTQVDYKTLGTGEAHNYHRYFAPVVPTPLAADLIEMAAPRPGEYAVDIACGTGVVTRLAAQRVGAAGKVVGVDLNPDMLGVARSIPAPAGAPIDWRQGNAESLPLPDDSYDLVLCQLGLMFVADKPRAVREMRRVLSPGGRVAINVPGKMPALWEIVGGALSRHIAPELGGFIGAVFSLDDPDRLSGLLSDNDFQDVTVGITTKRLRLAPPKEFLWQYIKATPIAERVAAADDHSQQQLERDVVAQWQQFVEDGDLVYEQPVLTATARK